MEIHILVDSLINFMTDKTSHMKVCLLFEEETIHDRYRLEVETMLQEADVEISLVVIDQETAEQAPPREGDHAPIAGNYDLSLRSICAFFYKLYTKGPRTLTNAERYLAENILSEETPTEKRARLKKPIKIDSIAEVNESPRIYFTPNKEGSYTYTIPDDVVDKIIATSDVVILLGYGRILRGRILEEVEYGVLSFHESDIRRYRGRPGCYWQFLNREDVIGVTLQQLTEDLDGGNIVVCKYADISDARTYWDVKLAATELYGSFLAEGINRLQDPNSSLTELSKSEMGKLTYESDRDKWRNEIRMTVRNFYGRYFS